MGNFGASGVEVGFKFGGNAVKFMKNGWEVFIAFWGDDDDDVK